MPLSGRPASDEHIFSTESLDVEVACGVDEGSRAPRSESIVQLGDDRVHGVHPRVAGRQDVELGSLDVELQQIDPSML